jgi:glycosyltransferase involved in cell wall biosynthesis
VSAAGSTESIDTTSSISRERQHQRVLLVPDSIHWITGTLARAFVAHNSWLDGTIISGPVLDIVARENPGIFDSFDLVHFVCPYASRNWLPRLHDRLPTVTSHHHVSDTWELQQHNLEGDAIIVGSKQWADDVVERGAAPERVVCIPYGVDASRFVPPSPTERIAIRQSLGIAPNAIVVGFFAKRSSNERNRKGTDIFAAGVRELSKDLPELAVLIIGPGWDELVAELTAAGVTCVWEPFVRDTARMPAMYQALDFYWVTARVEGGPVTLLEAMSTGVCCISTPVGLAREIVDNGTNGILVAFDDSSAFARQTFAYARRPDQRATLGAHARETIRSVMDVPVTSQGVAKAYDVAIAHFANRAGAGHHVEAARSLAPPLPASLLERIALLEQLAWAEALMLQGQRA